MYLMRIRKYTEEAENKEQLQEWLESEEFLTKMKDHWNTQDFIYIYRIYNLMREIYN